jgi:sulfonate transport system substrate-binding protein
LKSRFITFAVLAALLIPGLGLLAQSGLETASAQEKPGKIVVDYAYYNPSSLVLKKFGWLEEDLAADDVDVEWVLSAGSNKAHEFLRSDAIDFGSSAGAASLLNKANGSAIKGVYIFSRPEWTALVVPAGSEITKIEDLKGKKVAATKGTDPYFFLLRALSSVGLSSADVEVVQLQHADGKAALERGDVDAWAGLDPFMAQTELEAGSTLIYRNIEWNSWGVLNARQEFIDKYPDYVTRVLVQYERARQWILDNPDEAAQILADEAKLSLEVAKKELFERTVLTESPIPGENQIPVLQEIIPIFEAENQLQPGADANKALEELFEPKFIEAIVASSATPTP